MKKYDLSIIVPAYNEAAIIGETLRRIAEYCDTHELGSVELVVVAAGSDETGVIARGCADRFDAFQLIEPERKVGKGRDVTLGMLAARGAKQIFMDADLSTPLRHLEPAVKKLDEAEVVIGVRNLVKIHKDFLRAGISLLGNLLIKIVFWNNLRDTQCGFKGFTYEASQELFSKVKNTGWGFDIEVLQRAKEARYRVAQLAITDWHEPREEDFRGESPIKAALKTFVELWAIRFGSWERQAQRRPRLDMGVLLLGLGIFTALAAYQLGRSSIWFDEAFGIYMTQFSWLDIARYTAADVHPPFYYWLLKGWMAVFGASEVAVRSLSVVCGAAAMSVGFLLVRRYFGRRAAWLTLGLMVISPMLLRYAQEARMYTLIGLIGLAATYALMRASETKQWRWWAGYGALVSLGMWTHYFTALIWLTHWAWRWRQGTGGWRALTTKQWVGAHVIAVGLFIPWLPFMVVQLTGLQGNGFWIGPVGIDSLTNYLTNVAYYHDHERVLGWLAAMLAVGVVLLTFLMRDASRRLGRRAQWLQLMILLAIVPVVILFVASLPPLKSSFVERYLFPAALFVPLLAGIVIAVSRRDLWQRSLTYGLLIIMSVIGVSNVYFYGNYNKNTQTEINTKAVMREIQSRAQPGEPIIAQTPWLFYEAVFYETPQNPVYFIDETTEYLYGSLDMLKYNDQHKIKNLAAFSEQHPAVWFIGSSGSHITPPVDAWYEAEWFAIEGSVKKEAIFQGAYYITEE